MIKLGIIDQDVSPEQVDQYLNQVKKYTRLDWGKKLKEEQRGKWANFSPLGANSEMAVKDVQAILKNAGFFPNGGIDGICGYGTLSAIRLFQEYIRTMDGKTKIVPDGVAGPMTFSELKKWKEEGRKADWVKDRETWQQWVNNGNQIPLAVNTEYTKWLRFLEKLKGHYLQTPGRMLTMVNQLPTSSKTDTIKVADWDFRPGHIHLVGIRRKGDGTVQKFDDVLILLINGLVFKFQGSTDPGATTNSKGFPFLVQGQHNYHFGWHGITSENGAKTHQALKPLSSDQPGGGVAVVRSKDLILNEKDLDNGLEINNSINIHWAGKGLSSDVDTWSEGCQVIAGGGYANHHNQAIDCKSFAAYGNKDLGVNGLTRGAYNVLLDLVTAFSTTSAIKYMLLVEDDLSLDPEITSIIGQARKQAKEKIM
ncbi:MAG: peptidoglycan-binding protein [Bacteroidia bacterium]|nr:peptidoglycan-binding protein [Bacteroidia bacterium]